MNLDPALTEQNLPQPAGVIITGAVSQIGFFLAPALAKKGFNVYAVSRRAAPPNFPASENIKYIKAEISAGLEGEILNDAQYLIHIAPLELLPGIIEQAANLSVKRIIAFGTTGVYTKIESDSKAERGAMEKLLEAELLVKEKCERLSIAWTLFRPTMIYGCGLDKNVTTIAKFIKRFGFFPMAGEGGGLRRPVHAGDLANACLTILDKKVTFNRAYNLSGGEALTYREMVEIIFRGLGKKPRVIAFPSSLLRLLIKVANLLPQYAHLNSEMADRMNMDLCFDHSGAKHDFGYAPRNFKYQ